MYGMAGILPAYAVTEKYVLDATHTTVLFFIKHAGFSDMVGVVHEMDGVLLLDREDIENSVLRVNLSPKSIQTSSGDLDYMLQGKKFFHVKKHPNIHFVSTSIKQTSDTTAEVTGDLRLLGAIHPVILTMNLNKEGDMFGQHRLGFSARGAFKRSDFGMLAHIPLVSDEIRLVIETEMVREE